MVNSYTVPIRSDKYTQIAQGEDKQGLVHAEPEGNLNCSDLIRGRPSAHLLMGVVLVGEADPGSSK